MLRQFWVVPGLLDLFFVGEGSLELLVRGVGSGRPFHAVVHKPATVGSHIDIALHRSTCLCSRDQATRPVLSDATDLQRRRCVAGVAPAGLRMSKSCLLR